MSSKLYTVAEAADRMNTTTRFVRRLISERRIAFVRLGRHVRIVEEDLEAFVASGRVEPIQCSPRGWPGRVA
jgi:excisionase family DNA binding protein